MFDVLVFIRLLVLGLTSVICLMLGSVVLWVLMILMVSMLWWVERVVRVRVYGGCVLRCFFLVLFFVIFFLWKFEMMMMSL